MLNFPSNLSFCFKVISSKSYFASLASFLDFASNVSFHFASNLPFPISKT
jgi:hypothetical protein